MKVPPPPEVVAWAAQDVGANVQPLSSTVVRIQKDRDQTVVTDGPYQFVRHPAYASGIASSLMIPILLGSLWVLIPCGLIAVATVIRTALEDRTLLEELDGYKEYAQRVRYRLLPGVW